MFNILKEKLSFPGHAQKKDRRRQYWVKIRNFLSNYVWLVKDGVEGRKKEVIAIALAILVGVLAQGGTVAFLAFFVNIIQSQKKTGFSFLDNKAGNNLATLLFMSGVLFALLLLNAVSSYYVAVKSRALARAFHTKCSSRVLRLFNRLRVVDAALFDYSPQRVKKLAIRNSMLMGKSIEMFLQTAHPVFSLICVLAVVLKLNLKLSLIVFPFFVFVLPFLYKLSADIQRDSKTFYEASIKNMANRIRGVLAFLNATNVDAPDRERGIDRLFLGVNDVRNYYDNFDKVHLADNKAVFITSTFKSFFLVLVLIVSGYGALHNSLSWGLILAYIMAMQSVVNNLQSLSGNLSNMNRFYPFISSYIDFCNCTKGLVGKIPEKRAPAAREITIKARPSPSAGQGVVTLKPGDRALYFNKHCLSRVNFHYVISPLIPSSSLPEDAWILSDFVSHADKYFPGTLYSNVAGEEVDGQKAEAVARLLKDMNLSDELNSLPDGLHTVITDVLWEGFSDSLKLAVKTLPLVFSGGAIVFIESEAVKMADHRTVLKLWEMLADRFVFITAHHYGHGGEPFDVKTIIVSDDHGIVGIGDREWFDTVKARFSERQAKKTISRPDDDDQEVYFDDI